MGKKKDRARKVAEKEHRMTRALRVDDNGVVAALLAPVAKATDEPPLLALALGTLALGTMLRKPAMARTGARMLASHLLATGMKTVLKASVDRTRPNVDDAGEHLSKGSGTDRFRSLRCFGLPAQTRPTSGPAPCSPDPASAWR